MSSGRGYSVRPIEASWTDSVGVSEGNELEDDHASLRWGDTEKIAKLGVKNFLFISMKSVFQSGRKKPTRFAEMPCQSMLSTPMEQNLASDKKMLIF